MPSWGGSRPRDLPPFLGSLPPRPPDLPPAPMGAGRRWGGGGLRPPPPHVWEPHWRRRRRVRGVWGGGAPPGRPGGLGGGSPPGRPISQTFSPSVLVERFDSQPSRVPHRGREVLQLAKLRRELLAKASRVGKRSPLQISLESGILWTWQLLFCFDYRNIRRASCTQLFSKIFRPPKIKKIPPKRPVGPCALSRACPEPPGVLFRAQTVGILAKIGNFSVGRKSCVLGGRRDPNKRETAV